MGKINMKFKQITTGAYTYMNRDGYKQDTSHAVYGLDEEGYVWKFVPKKGEWFRLEDLDTNY